MKDVSRFTELQRYYPLVPVTISLAGVAVLLPSGAPLGAFAQGVFTSLSFWQYVSLSLALTGAVDAVGSLLDDSIHRKMDALAELPQKSESEFDVGEVIVILSRSSLFLAVTFIAFSAILALMVHVLSTFLSGRALVLLVSFTCVLLFCQDESEGLGLQRERTKVQRATFLISSFVYLCITVCVYLTYGFWASVAFELLVVTVFVVPNLLFETLATRVALRESGDRLEGHREDEGANR